MLLAVTVCVSDTQVSVKLFAERLTVGVFTSGTTVEIPCADVQLFEGSVATTV